MSEPRADRVGKLLREHPCTTANDVALAMTEELFTALHDLTVAKAATPTQVWARLLSETRDLRKENESLRAIIGQAAASSPLV